MNLSIEVEDESWNTLSGLVALAQTALQAALPPHDQRSVSLLFTNDEAMRDINRTWRGFDKPTNVLSFPAAPQPVPEGEVAHLGDLVLAWETVRAEAEAASKRLEHHITHLIVHGALHLQGYDHENEADATVMETKETGILATLGIDDPYTS